MNDKKRRARRKTNAEYLRIAKKPWGKRPPPSDEAIAKAAAEIDGEITKLKAQAAEVPKLRAEAERLEDKLRKIYHDVATLAAQFHQSYDVDVGEAAELAVKQIVAVKKILTPPAMVTAQEKAKPVDTGMRYEQFVMYVTGLRKFEQAIKRLKEFLAVKTKAKSDPEAWFEATLVTYRTYDGKLKLTDAERLKREISEWWKREKSRRAKKGGKARAMLRRCPECKKRWLEPKKRFCRYCGMRANVKGVGHSKDLERVAAAAVTGSVGKTPQREGEY
jgi:DNA repair exonuclease SbcCD ATPase subunit